MLAEILALWIVWILFCNNVICNFFVLDRSLYCMLLSSWYNMIQYIPGVITLTMSGL